MPSQPLIVERIYDSPVARVWSALTDLGEMKKWYFDIAAFEPKVGFEFTFNGQSEGRGFVHLCKITEVVPQKKIAYTWRYQGEIGSSLVSFELFPEGQKTKLRLTHTGLETFPAQPHFARKNFEMGWDYITGTSLKEHLEKN